MLSKRQLYGRLVPPKSAAWGRTPMTPQPQADRFPCPGCSADMQFDPATLGMKCPFCGKTQTLAAPPAAGRAALISSHPLDDFVNQHAAFDPRPLSAAALQVSCGACGSVVTFQPPDVAGLCPFCGDSLVAQPKAADPLLAPDAVLPAAIPKDRAQAALRAWLQSRWFAPNALKRLARPDAVEGVYLPFWDFDADTTTRYSGRRGEHYYETDTYPETDSEGRTVMQTRQVQRTKWHPASGVVSCRCEDVLIPASSSVSESRLNALQPWKLDSLRLYDPAFLAGFKAQRYQLELAPGFEHATQTMRRNIERAVRRDIGGDEQSIDSMETQYFNTQFRHLLLPVWIGAYRFQNKPYQVVVNASTGEVNGERPYSLVKIVVPIAAIVLLFVIYALVGLLLLSQK